MKIVKYKVVDAGATVSAATSQFATGKLVGAFSAATDVRFEEGILVKDIVKVTELPAVLADGAFLQSITFATAPSAGDEFMVTISYQDKGQREHRRFGYIAEAGSLTVTDIAAGIAAKINASDVPFTATPSSGVLTIAGNAGAGFQPVLGGGTDSSTTTVAFGSIANDAEKTDAAYYAAKFEGVDAADFGDAAVGYDAHIIEYLEDVDTVHGIVKEKRFAAFFTANTVSYGNLTTAFNAATYDGDKFDLL